MVLKFLNNDPVLMPFAWAALVVGTLVLVIGSYRFFSVRRRISRG